MNQTNIVDKLEQQRVRHRDEHPPLVNVNQAEILTPSSNAPIQRG
jgi:hypothetical protein